MTSIDYYQDQPDLDQIIRTARAESIAWARDLLNRTDWVILDTETTGLGGIDQALQIAVLSPEGITLLDTLVQVTVPIHPKAAAVHGITPAMLASAPTFAQVLVHLRPVVTGKTVVIYNADYDTRILAQTTLAAKIPSTETLTFDAIDAMAPYSAYIGEWNDYHGNFRWQRLPGGDHTALGDCRATLAIIKQMANTIEEEN